MNKLVVFTPLPPTPSGIADYFYEQLPYFAKQFHLIVVVKQILSQHEHLLREANFTIVDYKTWEGKSDWHAIPHIYHAGNNVHHDYIYWGIKKVSGIIVLHDFVQHHLLVEMTLAKGNVDKYKSLLAAELDNLGTSIANSRVNDYLYSDLFNFLIPLNVEILKHATSVITHSHWASRQLKLVTNKEVCVIPHHWHPPSSGIDENQTNLDIKPECDFLITSLGFITPPKQIQLTLRALEKIKSKLGNFKYRLVGEPFDKSWLLNHIKRHGLEEHVEVTGYVSLEQMERHIISSDIVVNLRYPSAGESSGTLARAMGAGKPTIIFDYAAFSDIPNDSAYKIDLDTFNTDRLESAILHLYQNSELRSSIGSTAKKIMEETCDVKNCVEQYIKHIREHAES